MNPTDAQPESFTTAAPSKAANADELALREFVIEAARLLNDTRCDDVVVFDVRGKSPLTDYLVIGTGTSDIQIRSVGHEVSDLGRSRGFTRYGEDSDASSTWVVVDMVHVMVHLFEPATRGHYDLEMLWGDSPKVSWRRKVTGGAAERETPPDLD